ncbi:MAG: WD40-repeat-containing domain protein [Olpidium bornovanus]|uniref:WD40-repeat-containing domain protein n=1 Tax=Olpidium bornovanus TaxID=278681 RepID=A0A8H8DM53_9FUNG|nr:MAG: WD40-repeat-containing domain protein [Olpidium bornovanus]
MLQQCAEAAARQQALYSQIRREEAAKTQAAAALQQVVSNEDADLDVRHQSAICALPAQRGSVQPASARQVLHQLDARHLAPEQPVCQQPLPEQPVAQQQVPQRPVVQQPVTLQPVPQQPVPLQPGSQQQPPTKRQRINERGKGVSQPRRLAAPADSGDCPTRRMSAPEFENSQNQFDYIKTAQPKRHSAGDLQELVHSGFPANLSSEANPAASMTPPSAAGDNQLFRIGGTGLAQVAAPQSDFALSNESRIQGLSCADPYMTGSNSDFLNDMFGGYCGDNDLFSIHSDKGSQNFQTLHAGIECPVTLEGHKGKVCSCAFSFDGAWLATAGVDGKIIVWSVAENVAAGSAAAKPGPKFVLVGHDSQINCVRWCSDDRSLLASASYDKTVRVWDVGEALARYAAGTLPAGPDGIEVTSSLHVFAGHSQTVTAVDFCREVGSELVASVDGEGCLKYWNCRSGVVEKEIRLPCMSYSMNPVRFNPRHSFRAAVCFGSDLALVDYASGDFSVVSTPHQKNIHSVEWSTDGANVVTASDDKVCVWRAMPRSSPSGTTPPSYSSAVAGQWATLVSSFDSPDKVGSVTFVGEASGLDSRIIFGGYQTVYDWRDVRRDEAGLSNCHEGVITGMDSARVHGSGPGGEPSIVVASVASAAPGNVKIWKVIA